MEVVRGGVSSSALALRRGLALEQAAGLYVTDRRLIITKEKAETHIGWQINGGAAFGSVVGKVNTYLSVEPRKIEDIDASNKKLDVALDEIAEVGLKPPGIFLGGHAEFKMKSGKSFKVHVVDNTQAYSEKSFEAIRTLMALDPVLGVKVR